MLLARKKFIAAEIEATYNTDPVPTQAIETSEVEINPIVGNRVDRNRDRAALGNDLQVLVNNYVELTFKCELAGSGALGVAPVYNMFLLACGMAETVVAATSVAYAPVSSAFDSTTIYFRHDGQLHRLTGARGSVALELDSGAIPRFAFSFMGLFNPPTSDPDGAPDFSLSKAALPVNFENTTTFQLHGQSPEMEKLSINTAMDVKYKNRVGSEKVQIYDRAPSGSAEFEAPAISVFDWFTTSKNNDLGALSFVHGPAGNRFTLSAPKVQILDPRYAGDDESMIAAGLGLIPNVLDDDFMFLFD